MTARIIDLTVEIIVPAKRSSAIQTSRVENVSKLSDPRMHYGTPKRDTDGGHFGRQNLNAAKFHNDFSVKWRTEEDSNPRPPDS